MYKPVCMKHFKLYELVSPEVMNLLGSNAWCLFNEAFIQDVDRFVDDIKQDLGCEKVIINDWKWGGGYTQSGFRELSSDVGAPNSQHRQGNGLDLKFGGITLDQAYHYILAMDHLYPAITRVENINHTPTWLHLDGKDTGLDGIYAFNP